jgi:hypothetical protein
MTRQSASWRPKLGVLLATPLFPKRDACCAPRMKPSIDFEHLTRSLIGMPVTKTWTGYGSTVFFEFGAMRPVLHGKYSGERGAFSLMLEWSWRVEAPRAIKFGSWSRDSRIEKGLAALEGEIVQAVSLDGSLPEITVDLGIARVRSFMTAEGQPAWTLFLPTEDWLCVRRGLLVRELSRA